MYTCRPNKRYRQVQHSFFCLHFYKLSLIREVLKIIERLSMTFTANGKWKIWNFCLLSSALCTAYNRVKLFIVAVNIRRRYSIVVCFINGFEVVFAVCRLLLTSCLTSWMISKMLPMNWKHLLAHVVIRQCFHWLSCKQIDHQFPTVHLCQLSRIILECPNSGGKAALREKFGGDVLSASQNPYPVYDQNLHYSLPCLWPDQKVETLFMTWPLNQNPVSYLCYN